MGEGGKAAMELRIAEQYLPQFGKIAQKSSTVVVPANLTDLGTILAMVKGIVKQPASSETRDVSSEPVVINR
jgi:hypothetical protein